MNEEIFAMSCMDSPKMAGIQNAHHELPMYNKRRNSENRIIDRGSVISHRQPRTIFTKYQISALKCIFDHKKYITQEEGFRIAAEIGITYKAVTIWFQNRRNKLKRSAKDEYDDLGYREYIKTILMKTHQPEYPEDLQDFKIREKMSLTTHTNFSHIISNNSQINQNSNKLNSSNLITYPDNLTLNNSNNDLAYNKNINNLIMTNNKIEKTTDIKNCKLNDDSREKEDETNKGLYRQQNYHKINNNFNNQKSYTHAGINNLIDQQENNNMLKNHDSVNSNSESSDLFQMAPNLTANNFMNKNSFNMEITSTDSDFFFDIIEPNLLYGGNSLANGQINSAVDCNISLSMNKINGISIFGSSKNGTALPDANSSLYKNLLLQARKCKEEILRKENYTD